ncbi:MAG: hypothetical protein MUF43_13915, partial [Flavobacterium sp.]|nr:hypothetical protein [Flavobacterium sp.]
NWGHKKSLQVWGNSKASRLERGVLVLKGQTWFQRVNWFQRVPQMASQGGLVFWAFGFLVFFNKSPLLLQMYGG